MNPKLKKHLLLASLATLLPIPLGLLIALRTPEEMGFHLKQLTIMPVCMLLAMYLAFWLTLRDPGNKGRNYKPLAVVLWVIPLMSNLCCAVTYALLMGYEFSPTAFLMVPMGLMFCAIGNYLPKVKMNSTMGIKVYWAYTSEENWAATHRFGGKTWFLGGLALALAGLLPLGIATAIMVPLFFLMTVLPMAYSWRYYRMQKARGDALQDPNVYLKQYKPLGKASGIFAAVIVIFVVVMMFTGDIEFQFLEDSLFIQADYYSDTAISYDSIASAEMRIGNIEGTRVGGFGSFRLLMGYFSNEEFGSYIRFTYYDPGCSIVVRMRSGQIYVLSGADIEETSAIYTKLQQQIG